MQTRRRGARALGGALWTRNAPRDEASGQPRTGEGIEACCQALRGREKSAVGWPLGTPRRTETGRGRARTESGETKPAGGRAPWPECAELGGAGRGAGGAEGGGAGRAFGALRRGGWRRWGARAVCARSAAPGGRWPGRESWGDARCPRTLARGHGGEPDRAAATQAGGRAVWAPPSPHPPPHCRWPWELGVRVARGRGRARAGESS